MRHHRKKNKLQSDMKKDNTCNQFTGKTDGEENSDRGKPCDLNRPKTCAHQKRVGGVDGVGE